MYELYAVTVEEALALLLVLAVHGTLIGYLVRRGWLTVPRPTSAPVAAAPRTLRPAAPPRHDRMAA